jgi:cardiolipin synthase
MLANCISSLRLFMAPALVYLLWQGLFLWSLLLMLGALISDVADGAVARKLNQVTNIGGLLDHGSDALLVLSGLVVFAAFGVIPWALPILVVIAFAQYVWDSGSLQRAPLRASSIGKLNGMMYFAFVILLIAREAFFLPIPNAAATSYLAWGLVLSTLVSITDRLIAIRHASRAPNN